jgi:hypothetical protein
LAGEAMATSLLIRGACNDNPNGLVQETGTDRDALAQTLVDMVVSVCVAPGKDRDVLAAAVIDLLGELRPANALEGMLVAQIATCHFLGMAQFGTAAKITNENAQQLHLQLGTKLQKLFLSQVDTLLKLRGVQQQKIRVESDGGPAIPGQAHTCKGGISE